MQIVFRTDASLHIGTGHVMRCLTLADMLHAQGCKCRFVCRDHSGNLLDLIRQHGHAVVSLPSDETVENDIASMDDGLAHERLLRVDWRTDAERTRDALGDGRVDWLIVDHYALDIRWEQELRPLCGKLMVIDDLADRSHECDLLLDQNLVANMAHRYDNKVPVHCGLMLGTEFALLQPQYMELHPRVPPREGRVRRVLIFFGGADAGNMTGKAIDAFLSLGRSDVALDVVVNQASPNANAIRQQVIGHPHISLHASLPTLALLMVKADLAIGAAGATSWERCCLGLPSLVVTLAENQRPIAAELERRGLIRWLGHKNEVDETELARTLAEVLQNDLLVSWSEKCSRSVDGRGAERVSAILTLNAQTPLRARLARLDDEVMILRWANDPLVRQNAFDANSIDAASHRVWFHERLRDIEHCRLYIVETLNAFPIGQVRLEKESDSWEIHYSLDATLRGRGLAKPMLQAAMKAFRSNTCEAVVFGRVKASNKASLHVFERLGFTSGQDGSGTITYRRVI